mmetsp:Transcript_8772/g.30122  ORF Transcript_8772/g.30122 Transcript_8772/m.30122 type:complete len:327 (+) Transcript_8772:419-1399(+)
MYSKVFKPSSLPIFFFSLWMSTTWPPTRPQLPTHLPTSVITLKTRSGDTSLVSLAMYSKASARRASPANIAMSSPYTLWQVGLPLLKSSLSRQGRSSWMRDMVWIISRAQAVGMHFLSRKLLFSTSTSSSASPAVTSCTSSKAARHSAGRMRFPPPSKEWRMAAWIVSGYCWGTASSRQLSTKPMHLASIDLRSYSFASLAFSEVERSPPFPTPEPWLPDWSPSSSSKVSTELTGGVTETRGVRVRERRSCLLSNEVRRARDPPPGELPCLTARFGARHLGDTLATAGTFAPQPWAAIPFAGWFIFAVLVLLRLSKLEPRLACWPL